MIEAASCLLLILGLLLIAAAAGDINARIIPSRLNAAIAVLAIPFWIAIGLGTHAMLIQIGLALAVLVLFAACFAFGMMGGGDVKLLAAIALWMPLGQMAILLVWMALAGGVLTLAMLIAQRLRRSRGRLEIPYGVAICAAALMIVTNDILSGGAA